MERPVQSLKIKFVVLGWFYEKYPDLIEGLKQLKQGNPEVIDVLVIKNLLILLKIILNGNYSLTGVLSGVDTNKL